MTLSRLSVLAASATAALACTAPAPAQFGEAAGLGQVMTPYYLRRDLPIFANGLRLDDGQAAIVESLFWDYEDAHEASKNRMLTRFNDLQAEIQNIQNDRDRVLEVVFEPIQEQADDWDRLNEQFLQSVQAILSSDQLERWDSFLRQIRREKELPSSKFSGEGLNLFHVVQGMDLDKKLRDDLEPALETYSITLDVALMRRERLFRSSRSNMIDSLRLDDGDESIRIIREQIDSRVQVRNANLNGIETVAAGLPDSLAASFRQAALEEAFPRAYRRTAAQRLFESALELDDLSEEVRTAIVALELAYSGEIAEVSRRIADLIQQHQPKQALERAENFNRRQRGQVEEHTADPTREAFRERQEIDRRYAAMLRDLLTPEQFESLDGASRFIPQAAEDESPADQKRRQMREMSQPGLDVKRPRAGGPGNGKN